MKKRFSILTIVLGSLVISCSQETSTTSQEELISLNPTSTLETITQQEVESLDGKVTWDDHIADGTNAEGCLYTDGERVRCRFRIKKELNYDHYRIVYKSDTKTKAKDIARQEDKDEWSGSVLSNFWNPKSNANGIQTGLLILPYKTNNNGKRTYYWGKKRRMYPILRNCTAYSNTQGQSRDYYLIDVKASDE